jgi:hypothetical protein
MKQFSNGSINCMIVPTGIGARIGGYAGDANPAAKLLAKASDVLITHPNVVNAGVITDIPNNIMVVEGYFLDRFFAGQLVLRPNLKHKIAVVMDSTASEEERELNLNCMNAARHVYGMDIIEEVFYTDEPVEANDLRQVKNHRTLIEACVKARSVGATALAVLCVLDEEVASNASKNYSQGKGYDPIGQIEAKISHLVAQLTLLPCAHAPILRSVTASLGEAQQSRVQVAPRVAAEYLSDCFLASVLKCLQASPGIIPSPQYTRLFTSDYTNPEDLKLFQKPGDITVTDLSNLVVPYDSCNGTPMVEAWKSEVTVVCVANNTTNLEDTAELHGVPHVLVSNYLEAAGYILANTKDRSYINPKLFLN